MTRKTLRTTLLACAAFATVAAAGLASPQIALASEAGMSTSIQPAQRFRAADNGSAEVRVAAPVAGTVAVDGALTASDAMTADRRRAEFTADRKRAEFTADRKRAEFTADRRRAEFTADRKRADFTADRKRAEFTADRRRAE